MILPLSDPQFWLVTALVALVALSAARKVRRTLRSDAESPCASCPKVAAVPLAADGDRKSRLRVVSLFALALLPTAARAASVERTVAAMGTTLRVEVEIARDRATALAVAEAMIRAVEATEARLSTWRETSELAAFNRAPVGRWLAWSSPELARALIGAFDCSEETNGAFDLTIAPLVEAWGLRRGGRKPSAAEIDAARARVDWKAISSSSDPESFLKQKAVTVEEGGFGKGAALDLALDLAELAGERGEVGFVQLDFGGQIAWANAVRPTRIDLAHPRDRGRPVLELALLPKRGSVATSGNGARRDGVGHLIDPRTGRMASDFGSATAVESSALRADCLSTGLFVLGPPAGSRLLTDGNRWHEGIFLVVEGEELRALVSPALEGRVRALGERVVVEILKMQQ